MLNIIQPYQALIEKELATLHTDSAPVELYESVRYVLMNGGKRIRPVLTLISTELFGGKINAALPAALALELFHNSTLVHDDIMDKADLRRGAPSVHKKWDINRALLVGDIMVIMAYTLLGKLRSSHSSRALTVFNDTFKKVYEGQTLDVAFESKTDVTLEAYKHMIGLKTAALFAASMKMGAVIAEASEGDQEKIERFGFNLGIAFQIHDDLLDFFGKEKALGKLIGMDLRSGKKTFLTLKANAVADKLTQEKLHDLLTQDTFQPEETLQLIKTIFVELNIDTFADNEKKQFTQKAINDLKAIQGANAPKELLKQIIEDLSHRNT